MRTIAIIGDSKGIGLALRQRLLERGDRVIGVSRTGAQAEGNYTGLVFDAAAHPCDLSAFTDRLDGLGPTCQDPRGPLDRYARVG